MAGPKAAWRVPGGGGLCDADANDRIRDENWVGARTSGSSVPNEVK